MRLLVCGDRNWTDFEIIRHHILRLCPDVVIHGAAQGADSLAVRAARELGILVESYPAEWDKYGRAAGPIRNRQMLREGKPDQVLAFHHDIMQSKGTADMLEAAGAAGIPWELVCYREQNLAMGGSHER